MNIVHQKLQIDEPLNESYPGIDLNGYEFESWKTFLNIQTNKKSPKKSPAPSQDPSAVSKREAISGTVSQINNDSQQANSFAGTYPKPSSHFGHNPPPQSSSVSGPFSVLSLQPSSHFGHNPPPQSSSVSGPFSVLSLQVGAKIDVPRQMTPSQTSLIQSLLTLHFKPSSHFGHNPPPQSSSVSGPFAVLSLQPSSHFGHSAPPQSSSVSGPLSVLSLQVGAKTDVPRQITPSQTSLTQSLLTLHFKPSSHFGHNPPPQSSSVSGPFSVLSLQVGAKIDVPRQITPSQTSLIQSLLTLHFKPSSHFGHSPPPQSSSVSGPFSVLSLQLLISVPRQITPSQTSLIQSLLTLHFKPSSHFGHNPPPQSSSVSCPFTVLSTQVAAKIEDELYYFTFN
ncbi:unnamed protein product [Rotaria sordida]|uniref:Uncharacterized protein n=1 Tax=Rotaria sordida TaxID=392033 RepID=A0A818LCM7_9BILA|nr:unnamed protein product [Rotaria sordida]